jgi:glycosyltransferase involved in cell wall biosynthesis
MKIIFIITGLNTGGAESMLLKLLEHLPSCFFIQVISLTNIGPIGKKIQMLGIPVIALGMLRGIPDPFAVLRLVRIFKEEKPDIVHTWMYHADLIGGLAARIASVSILIWNIRHSNFAKDNTKLSTRLVAYICAQLSPVLPYCIQCCSAIARDIHIKLGYSPQKFVVIPNGFDLDRFQPDPQARESVRKELGICSDTSLIGLIARFDYQKNHLGFIDAIRILHQERPDVNFLLAGKDIDKHNNVLRTAINQAGVNHVTHLLGLREDIPRLMASLDILVSASSFGEAFPNVLGEAMACEVPCVVTDVGDSAYIIGECGRIIMAGDMPGLARAIYELLSLTKEELSQLGKKARNRVSENFEINHITNIYISMYENLFNI